MTHKASIIIYILLYLVITPLAVQSEEKYEIATGAVFDIQFDATFEPDQIDEQAVKHFKSGGRPTARYTVDVYMIQFTSTYLDGTEARIKAQLFIPRFREKTERPVYIFAPGSTGLMDACRPSRAHIAGINWGEYRIHVLSFAGKGMIGLLPDYTGFGDPEKLQPYYVAEAEAMMLLDAVRAVRNFFSGKDYPVRPHPAAFLAGYSQGGHAVFAAADYRDEYAPDVEIGGLIGYGAARSVEALFREFTVSAPLVIYTYSRIYGEDRFNPALMLQDYWLERLEKDVTRLCIGGIQDYYPWVASKLYRPEFNTALHNGTLSEQYSDIAQIMEMNSTGLSGHGIPAFILQGTDDVVVHPQTQTDFVIELRKMGSDVLYYVYDGSRHDTRAISFDAVVEWMEKGITGG